MGFVWRYRARRADRGGAGSFVCGGLPRAYANPAHVGGAVSPRWLRNEAGRPRVGMAGPVVAVVPGSRVMAADGAHSGRAPADLRCAEGGPIPGGGPRVLMGVRARGRECSPRCPDPVAALVGGGRPAFGLVAGLAPGRRRVRHGGATCAAGAHRARKAAAASLAALRAPDGREPRGTQPMLLAACRRPAHPQPRGRRFRWRAWRLPAGPGSSGAGGGAWRGCAGRRAWVLYFLADASLTMVRLATGETRRAARLPQRGRPAAVYEGAGAHRRARHVRDGAVMLAADRVSVVLSWLGQRSVVAARRGRAAGAGVSATWRPRSWTRCGMLLVRCWWREVREGSQRRAADRVHHGGRR